MTEDSPDKICNKEVFHPQATTSGADLPLVIRRDDGSGFSLVKKDDHYCLLIYKPDDMDMAKWEKHIIKTTQGLSNLGITVRRINV
tara:strand:- start:683 stop:940 length:258 start_codon:yes stop_codon:yes gene_type:complete